jgi:hypothetical protein
MMIVVVVILATLLAISIGLTLGLALAFLDGLSNAIDEPNRQRPYGFDLAA